MAPVLYIVIPCYNEEAVLPVTSGIFRDKIRSLSGKGLISGESRVVFVNDGSSDSTWDVIKGLSDSDDVFEGISLSRNRGHQNALLAGLMTVKDRCDITVSIDCNGQDDIDAVDEMVAAYTDEGCEIVYGIRSSRKSDSFFKRFTAESFYRLLNSMGADVKFNHADYRLISSRVLEELESFEEVNLYLRGLVPMLGFKSKDVFYERHERLAGESHYSLGKMLALAFNGITSLTVKPIRIITAFGFTVSLLSFIAIIWAVIRALTGHTVAGWASMTCIICFFSGIILLSLGVIGEYIGKIYLEAKRRPRFIIEESTLS